MMHAIQILPEAVASQIAAGEVIERPASVVKELLENALDAGARQVTVRVEDAGRRLMEIADDGAGIAAAELPLAVTRHATSKLRSAEDLFHIQTLGFRGEALASIGSVSRLTLTSRPAQHAVGARLVVEGGTLRANEPLGTPEGTVVRVENLFFNVPARLKFLKRDITERQQIDALVTRYALAYPQVRFSLFQDGRAVLQTSGNGDRREILASLLGVDTARQMIEVALEDQDVRVQGYISPVALTRSNRREITFFVNGRWVQDSALSTALLQAYRTLLMVGRFPLAVLFVELDPEAVDVNVHPAKAEVRFRSPDAVFSGVQRAVRRALLTSSPVPQVSSGWQPPQPTALGQGAFDLHSASRPAIDPAWDMAADLARAEKSEGAAVNAASAQNPAALPPSGMLPLLRLVGQVGGTYLVAEGPDGLYLIDQHAAHERVLFERMMGGLTAPLAGQALLEAAVVQLPAAQAALLNEQIPLLSRLGFDIEPFGPNTFRVRAIPALITGSDPAAAVRVLVEDFEEDETPLQAEREARLVARICKRAAVKGGQSLSPEEQRALLRDLEACFSPRTCPHGRPTMIHLTVDVLERQFGRRGSR
ncbi:DNA mismatch repair endonuclease MutL [Levilinea saccharolytica]|nr:DNA mismatch repair endonuclease MutL [Levilinea saccharolytica]GAP18594.1 DNA mismatch repair protein MutL [Levilinea saccharolytica]